MNGDTTARSIVSAWDETGVATLEATGVDGRAALEAALQAVLALAVGHPDGTTAMDEARAVPVRGEGDDLAALFADLTEDLLVQLTEFSGGLRDVSLGGLLRRDDGGFVAWGYAMTARNVAPQTSIGLRETRVIEDARGITVRATLERGQSP